MAKVLGGKSAGRQKSVYYCGRQKSWAAKECFLLWAAKEFFQPWAAKECLAKAAKIAFNQMRQKFGNFFWIDSMNMIRLKVDS